jgi:hypothetical protein
MTNILKFEPTDYILEKALDGQRISPQEALEVYTGLRIF